MQHRNRYLLAFSKEQYHFLATQITKPENMHTKRNAADFSLRMPHGIRKQVLPYHGFALQFGVTPYSVSNLARFVFVMRFQIF